ncbi:hypothetical protein [Pseudanabaena sp. FACHB-2040]|uniref:hypothetical protein n=1 Tax=Pseudanabaena sp. FACHB-2040 TaxID=2692859 RepID=UPI001685A280|nr:hypothetical protein [Pseudanabaena sp. FACHB-2040]MBD2257009.1 hypothetical protein [Pseudanabaena sp. FACHB-2040]
MTLYLIPATLVFAIALRTLMRDVTASKADVETWICFTVAALLWPLTLPAILYKKYFANLTGPTNLLPAQPKRVNAL